MGLPMSDPTAWATAMNNLGMAPMGMTGQPLLPGTSAAHAARLAFKHGAGKNPFQLNEINTYRIQKTLISCVGNALMSASDLFRDQL